MKPLYQLATGRRKREIGGKRRDAQDNSQCRGDHHVGAVSAFAQDRAPFVGAHGAMVPDTYAGSITAVDWHLDIWPDQTFHLVRTPSDGGGEDVHAGRWHADGRNLLLDLGSETLRLEVRNAGRMRPQGTPDDVSGDLVGAGRLDPAPISLPVAGMFTYHADAPSSCIVQLVAPTP